MIAPVDCFPFKLCNFLSGGFEIYLCIYFLRSEKHWVHYSSLFQSPPVFALRRLRLLPLILGFTILCLSPCYLTFLRNWWMMQLEGIFECVLELALVEWCWRLKVQCFRGNLPRCSFQSCSLNTVPTNKCCTFIQSTIILLAVCNPHQDGGLANFANGTRRWYW